MSYGERNTTNPVGRLLVRHFLTLIVCVTIRASVGRKARKSTDISSTVRNRFEGNDDINGAIEIRGGVFSLRAQNFYGMEKGLVGVG
jgi:hypothetical protein